MFRRSNPASRLSNTELKKLELLFEMVDSCTVDMQRPGQDTSRQLADSINQYPNGTMVYEVLRRVRKCFKSGNPQVVLRALDLTDTLMQSCGSHARREVGSDKFLKQMGKLCKVTKTKMDPSWQAVGDRAQDLVEEWADSSEQSMGPGNRFVQAYHSLKREGVMFRGTSSRALAGYTPTGHARPVAFGSTMGGHVLGGGGVLAGGPRVLYDEEAELAAAIASSLGVTSDGRNGSDSGAGGAGGAGGGAASSMELTSTAEEDGDILSRVPPTIEALMDILEGSKDLTELLDNEVVPDVVDQTRGLVEQVIKQVEQMQSKDNPDEKDMDRYLKAHDDLQTVLKLYEGVLDGKTTLPLRHLGAEGVGGGGLGGALGDLGVFEEHMARTDRTGDALDGGGDGRGKEREKAKSTASSEARGTTGSPATGNLLDLDETAPLDAGGVGDGKIVPFAGGQFQSQSSNNFVGGAAPGGGGVVGEGFGSGTVSNLVSDTGAVFGSGNPGSILGSGYGGSSGAAAAAGGRGVVGEGFGSGTASNLVSETGAVYGSGNPGGNLGSGYGGSAGAAAAAAAAAGGGGGAGEGFGSGTASNLLSETGAVYGSGNPGSNLGSGYGGSAGAAAAAGCGSGVGEGFGSNTASNLLSETGAVYGSSNLGSNRGSAYGSSSEVSQHHDPFASFQSALSEHAPDVQAPGAPGAPVQVSSFATFGESPSSNTSRSSRSSATSSNATGRQSASDFGTWMSSVRGSNPGATDSVSASHQAFGVNGSAVGGVGGSRGRQIGFAESESTSFQSSNGGFITSPTLGPIAETAPAIDGNPFESPASASGGSGRGAAAGGARAGAYFNGTASRNKETSDPFSLSNASAFGAPRRSLDGSSGSGGGGGRGGGGRGGGFTQGSQALVPAGLAVHSSASSTSFQSFPASSATQVPQRENPRQQQQQQQQQQWWQPQQQQQQVHSYSQNMSAAPPPGAAAAAADPFAGAIVPAGGAGFSPPRANSDPFSQFLTQPPATQSPAAARDPSFGSAGGGGVVVSAGFDSGRGHFPRLSDDSESSLVSGPALEFVGNGGGVGIEGSEVPRKVNPFDAPMAATTAPGGYGTQQQGSQRVPQQQQVWPPPVQQQRSQQQPALPAQQPPQQNYFV